MVTLSGEPSVSLVKCVTVIIIIIPLQISDIGGRLAVQWAEMGIDKLKNAILENLSTFFGTWAREPSGFILKDWQDEPFIGGATVCIPSVGSMHAFHAIRRPCGPIHFAGTETSVK